MANLLDGPKGYDPRIGAWRPHRDHRISSFGHRILAGAKFPGPIPDNERRRLPRRQVRMEASLKLQESIWRGAVSDIGLGGVSLFFGEAIPAAHNQFLEIGLLTEAGVLEIKGAIRDIRPTTRMRAGSRQTGQSLAIEFHPLDVTSELILASFIDALHEQSLAIQLTGTLLPLSDCVDRPSLSPPLPLQEATAEPQNQRHLEDRRVTSRFAVGVPLVLDFNGRLSNGVSCDLSLDTLTIDTDLQTAERVPVSVRFFLAEHPPGLNIASTVVAIRENPPGSDRRFRIVFRFYRMTDLQRARLELVLREFGYTGSTSFSGTFSTNTGANPKSLLSVFVSNNPSPLRYGRQPRLDQDNRKSVFREGREQERRLNGARRLCEKRFAWTHLPQALLLALQVGRDLLLRLLPPMMARLLAPRIAFAFIAHPRDLADVPRKFPLAYFLPTRFVDLWFLIQWPFVASYITGLKTRSGKTVRGAMIISPLTTAQMIRNPRAARARVCQAVKLAEKMGAKVVGLGAFTSIVTRDGNDLLGKVNVGITTGNPHSAAIAVQNVLMASSLTGLSLPHATAAIVGSAGSVGSACAKLLSPLVGKLVLVDIKQAELNRLLEQLRPQTREVEATGQIESVRQADIVIVATNSPHILIAANHLKPGAIVIDAAQPKNVSELVPLERKDVLVIESAIVNTPDIDCHFDLGLGNGEALGCLSETMILSGINWEGHYSLGKADPQQAAEMIAAGRSQGFRLAHFRNSIGYITEENLASVARARLQRTPLSINA